MVWIGIKKNPYHINCVNNSWHKPRNGRFIGKKTLKDIPIYGRYFLSLNLWKNRINQLKLIGSFAWNDEDLSYEIDIYSNTLNICLYYITDKCMILKLLVKQTTRFTKIAPQGWFILNN